MANRHYDIDQELEITLKVKVKIERCSNYNALNEIQLAEHVIDFKNEIKDHIKSKIENTYYREEVTMGVDDWTYTIE